MENIIIPHCLQIALDDVGWFCGCDERSKSGPSRTAMPRFHMPEDYTAVNELGKALNMKINCGFVMGEWDMENELKKIPCFSKYGDNWNNSFYRDADEIKKCAEIIRDSEYIDIAVHGLMHGYYCEGIDNHDVSDFYYQKNGELFMIPENEVRQRLDAFFMMCRKYNFAKKITSFIPPSFVYRVNELSTILKDYGILYVSTMFIPLCTAFAQPPETAFVENGIITVDRKCTPVPWNDYMTDYNALEPAYGILGLHWPNFLHLVPQKNMTVVENSLPYFKKCANTYGIILSRDMAFCASQSLFKRYAAVSVSDNTFEFDISGMPNAEGLINRFYISARKDPVSWTNCTLSEYEVFSDFTNYEIIPQGNKFEITL